MRKKLTVGAAVLALLMNAPQVSAEDDIVIFGGEFEDEATAPAPKEIEKPAPKKDLPSPVEKPKPEKPKEEPKPEKPKEEPKPEIVEPPDKPPTQPLEQPEPPTQIEQPIEEPKPPAQIEQPIEEPTPPAQIEQPIEEPTPPAQIEQPIEEPTPPVEPLRSVDKPFQSPTNIRGGQERIEPTSERRETERRYFPQQQTQQPQSNLRTLKQRFIKLAVDDTYTYYLDKTSVQWKRIPYLANEYMADVWVRMIEHSPAKLDDDMANYGADNFSAEIAFAREQGYQYSPEDLKVLRSQAYVLEHYYLRPKTKQIQFLCELEVFGRPQNAINERAYDNKNWEYLVPGSVESSIYNATIKIIGKSKATGRGHMTFFDMLDEYGRIALN